MRPFPFEGLAALRHPRVTALTKRCALRKIQVHRMTLRRRDFLGWTAGAALIGALPRGSRAANAASDTSVYDLPRFGNARILHMTDTHAQLQPVLFREPSVNLGIGTMLG